MHVNYVAIHEDVACTHLASPGSSVEALIVTAMLLKTGGVNLWRGAVQSQRLAQICEIYGESFFLFQTLFRFERNTNPHDCHALLHP